MSATRLLLASRRRPLWMLFTPAGALLLLIVLIVVGGAGITSNGAGARSQDPTCGGTAPAGNTAVTNQVPVTGGAGGLTDQQLSNARTVAGTVLGAGGGRIGVRIAMVTVYTEATLVAVNYGDVQYGSMTSSRGLYQQMDPWGPLEVRLDPAGSTLLFLNGGQGGQKGLFDIPNWWTLDPWVAAQAVEQSQFSDGSNYRGNLATTNAIVDSILAGQTVSDLPDPTITSQQMISAPTDPAVQVAAGSAPTSSGPAAPCPVSPTGQIGVESGPASGLALNLSQDPSSFGWVRAQNQVEFAWQGKTFGQVAGGTEGLWTGLLNDLVPQIPGGLNSDVGCFEDRDNVNSPGRASFHAYGLACDLNSGVNCNGCPAESLQGRQFGIPIAAAQAAAAKWGMIWGGDFKGTPDPMHFEIHLSPQQIAGLGTAAATESATSPSALAGATAGP